MVGTDHIAQIMLAPELRSALIQYGAKHDLDKQYAVLHLLVKSLRSEGLLSSEDAEFFLCKYGKTITAMSARQAPRPMTLAQLQEKTKYDEKNRTFTLVIEQWDLGHKPGWKDSWIRQAEQLQEKCPEAKRLLDKIRDKVFVK